MKAGNENALYSVCIIISFITSNIIQGFSTNPKPVIFCLIYNKTKFLYVDFIFINVQIVSLTFLYSNKK